jgi:hypothetical protein
VTGKTKPHIVIADFLAWEPMEEILGRWIQRICCRHQSFPVTLNNYSGFPLHTIYIRIEDPRPFRQLAKELKSIDEFIRSSACPPVKLVDRPWLSVAGRLAEQVYSRAMADYSQKIFHESFLASELVLLKRKHPLDTCKVVNIFRFLPAGPDCREAA